ncbi:hypothetical protein CCAX7_20780 [Capsulimonas corticalis]|uniref:Uncharacterized protein n=1 Tax=Capsulimonas corticalis TaxID=2219043 RepID=A0A402D2B0_9BACT|nr:DUF6368 family protein [Capsulimonas corticalis]BDI30027.1 hypothetical protein CCAX7_20780 [Capsulimonas corticalis]
MGGPSCSILVARELDETQHEALDRYMDSISTGHDGNEYQVRNLRSKTWKVTLPLPGLFWVGVEPCEWNPGSSHNHLFAEAFGFAPRQYIGCSSICSGEHNDRILGEIVAAISEIIDGIVDFESCLWPPLPLECPYDHTALRKRARWSEDCEPAFRNMVKRMPGRVVGIPIDGKDWVTHYADSRFMRAWMGKPRKHYLY